MSTELVPLAVLMGLVTYPFRVVPLLSNSFQRLAATRGCCACSSSSGRRSGGPRGGGHDDRDVR